ncbi:hypothetical protein [Streptacidiphilus sp. P02-A3a]|uniref:hypothetical protein n=1 Tax=Streptacidiphilus sp. P02-A3a TaxID=2704468 RepID=UPI0015F9BCF9|nr:hypothetical protein [Streptacidiphilus sp. P02-A3a]QMU72835.1 hypothetical protein GXP74_35890 [Streptacidiphilus sp. P02-A3a]
MTEKSPVTTTSGPPGAVSVEIDTLTAFRDRVNALLASLDSGPAAPGSIGRQGLTESQLGNTFAEVKLLVERYGVVHSQLQALSRTLTDQINAMGITLQVSQVGYEHVEAEQISRLWLIQNQTTASQPPPAQANRTVAQQLAAAASAPAPAPTRTGSRQT